MALSTVLSAPLPLLCLCGGAGGVLSHLGYFIHGDHHLNAYPLFLLVFTTPVLTTAGRILLANVGFLSALVRSVSVMSSFLASLWVSMVVYRIFFHPLRNFPGPLGAKVSKLWHVKQVLAKCQNYKVLHGLQKEYGDFVRTGPSEISVFDPEGVQTIQGVRSKCTKSAWYETSKPLVAMQLTRDKAAHDKRRRLWDHGFGAASLKNYEDRILDHAKILLDQIRAQSGKAMSATKWFQLYGFDVMTDIAFGKSFNMTKSGKPHYALELLQKGMEPLGKFGHAPWFFILLKKIPGLATGYRKFLAWCSAQVMERVKMDKEIEQRDVMSWLVESYNKSEDKEQELIWLNGDSRLIIVAGSDTTSSTLTFAAFELAKHPDTVQKLREEIANIGKDTSSITFKDLQSCEHLNAIINETLRLHPPVPGGVLRVTPPEGITVGKTFIPGGTTVTSPAYTIGRSPAAWEYADDFIPERWTSKPELVKDKSGYAPFSMGPYGCIGKQLALMELRIVLFMLVTEFDISLAPGEDGSNLEDNTKDFFTVSLADLQLVFSPRLT